MDSSLTHLFFWMLFTLVILANVALLGYILSKKAGMVGLVVLVTLAAIVCLGSTLLGWAGLVFAIVVILIFGSVIAAQVAGKRGAAAFGLTWVGWCALCIFGYQTFAQEAYQVAFSKNYPEAYQSGFLRVYRETFGQIPPEADVLLRPQAARKAGYQAGVQAEVQAKHEAGGRAGQLTGPAGLVLITLPILILFELGAYALSQKLLPFGGTITRQDRLNAFRVLLTYTFGTNYAYFAVKDRKKILRVPSRTDSSVFAGPGMIITSCDHTVVTSDGVSIKGIKDPGLSFTELSEEITEVIDLRFQQRAFAVEALTKDGIRIKTTSTVSFRIHAGDDWPEPGHSFPFRKSAVFNAVRERPIEHLQEQNKVIQHRLAWDEMVSVLATQVARQVIGDYAFDDLCGRDADPRQEIIAELHEQLKDKLRPLGIQVTSCVVGDLLPVDDQLVQRRIENWQAEWTHRILGETARQEAEYARVAESARAQAQAGTIFTIRSGLAGMFASLDEADFLRDLSRS
jgi:hypothetical protein